jgi:LacI family transcriptional regulator
MAQIRHVALIVETSIIFGRQLLGGITRYLQAHDPWSVFLEQRELGATPPAWLEQWDGDGVICRVTTPALADQFCRADLSVVDLNDFFEDLGFCHIWSDHRRIGAMAAEHLLERGFRHFAFCGFSQQHWSDLRHEGFERAVQEQGHACAAWHSPWSGADGWDQEQAGLAQWLEKLPKPVAVMACNDMRGQHVLDAAQRLDLAVPEQIAVIGVDDDQLLCNLCRVPLTSIVPDPDRIGYESAAALDRMMRGERAGFERLDVPPLGISMRQSTDVLAIEDPQIAGAVRFIRERAREGCRVEDVLRHVPMARTTLERKFRKYLGRSPQAEIRHVQVNRAKQLLIETDLSLEQIAGRAGFRHPEYMSVVFKRETGTTPGRFRREGAV